MISEHLSYSYAFLFGLLSSTHCVGMCGGITAALTFGIPAEQRTPIRTTAIMFAYNIGRIITYTLMGLLLGGIAQLLQDNFVLFSVILRTLAGLLLIAMGLYISQLWQGLVLLEKIGQFVWRFIQPFSRRWLPVTKIGQALGLGIIWGVLPCGLVYSVLVWSMSANSVTQSAAIMFCFGLGTLPTLITLGVFSNLLKNFLQSKSTRLTFGIIVVVFGIWTLWFTYQHTLADEHEHTQMEHMQHEQHLP